MNKQMNLIAYIEDGKQQIKSEMPSKKEYPKYKDTIIIPKGLTDSDAEGFFGPGSMHWKLYREPGLMVGGISALLLQIAHPAVAVGVAQYSQFQKDFLGRAHRTIFSMVKIWMGSKTEAVRSAKRLHGIHHHIRGVFKEKKEGKITNRAFCANDPDLLVWVLATMVQATYAAYESVYHPLSKEEANRFYEETKITAQLMGIPLEIYPANLDEFNNYYKNILAGDVLEVGVRSHTISKDLFRAYFPFARPIKAMAAGFLSPRLNESFDLKYGHREQRRFRNIIRFFKIWMKIVPCTIRYAPHYHRALYRIAKAEGKSPNMRQKWHHWIGKNIRLPIFFDGLKP